MPSDAAPGPASPDLGRLRWQCRRGMLELDLLLRDFLDQHYQDLPATQQAAFVRLLGSPDPLLYDWLMGHGAPEDVELRELVTLLRK